MSATTASQRGPQDRLEAERTVCALLGVLLIVAAFAKGLSPADSVASVLQGWPLAAQLLAVEAELMFGIILLCGFLGKLAHCIALVVFALFATFALQSVVAHEESCGCFGAITIDPRLTLVVDLAALTALGATWPSRAERLFPARPASSRMIAGAALAAISAGVLLGIAKVGIAPTQSLNAMVSTGGVVLFEPEAWVGKKLPLLGLLENAQGLADGEWAVLMHHHGCPDCERVRPIYENRINRGERVLLIETPPFDGQGREAIPKLGYAWLPDDREWFVQTPVEILLDDGLVVSVNRDLLRQEATQLAPLL